MPDKGYPKTNYTHLSSLTNVITLIIQEITYRKILKTTNTTHIQNTGNYLDIVKNKWFSTIIDM
jgi:hypothetical protein